MGQVNYYCRDSDGAHAPAERSRSYRHASAELAARKRGPNVFATGLVPTHCAECGGSLEEPWETPGDTLCDVCRDEPRRCVRCDIPISPYPDDIDICKHCAADSLE